MNLNIGLDLGSTAIKLVMTEGDRLLWRSRTPTAPGQEAAARRLMAGGLAGLGLDESRVRRVAATGYGKKLFAGADKNIDEISANAAGIFKLSGARARTVINIGGQDLKVMTLDDRGRILDFKMNDKCAAGTGRFFEQAARILDTPLSEFGSLGRLAETDLELNSTCVVFAESEMVSLLARGAAKEDIVKSLNHSVARRVAGLMGRSNLGGDIYLDGGPAQNAGLVAALEDELMAEIKVVEEPQFTVAYGAALSLLE
ncbi:MAG: acyl-CoA dehydratase activase [Candidatus Adiutrix sp.]|jgi:predicted CoA-substrate-specific enzyme activase|nr:acyl-CoA dehydratase activase [Candidatus Adiutrix sp.]